MSEHVSYCRSKKHALALAATDNRLILTTNKLLAKGVLYGRLRPLKWEN